MYVDAALMRDGELLGMSALWQVCATGWCWFVASCALGVAMMHPKIDV